MYNGYIEEIDNVWMVFNQERKYFQEDVQREAKRGTYELDLLLHITLASKTREQDASNHGSCPNNDSQVVLPDSGNTSTSIAAAQFVPMFDLMLRDPNLTRLPTDDDVLAASFAKSRKRSILRDSDKS